MPAAWHRREELVKALSLASPVLIEYLSALRIGFVGPAMAVLELLKAT